MSDLGNKEIMAKNLRRLMSEAGIDRNMLCGALGFKYSTVSEWLNATAYPRIDKIELMARYFGVPKSALVEEQLTADEKAPDGRADERFKKFYDLSERDQKAVESLIDSLLSSQDND